MPNTGPSSDEVPLTQIGRPELDALVAREATLHGGRRTLRCRTVADGHLRQMNYVRDLKPYAIEERIGPGREDAAPTPSEALLAALGSCLSVGIHANAVARFIPIRTLHLDLEADLDSTGAWGVAGVAPCRIGFEAVRITVHIDADASHEVLKELVAHVVLWSPAANTIHDPVHLDVVVTR